MNPDGPIAELTGVVPVRRRQLAGSVFEVELADGDRVVAKWHRDPNAVRAEAASLRWLTGPPTPAVRGHDEHWLVIDHVPPVRDSPEAAERFGRALAALHASGAPAFGAAPPGGPVDAAIGLAPMRNVPGADWPTWYLEHRVEPYLRLAVDGGVLSAEEARRLASARIDAPAEPPARLHGDLWSGNVHWAADGRVWLIDPAAHGGHRETDLAMLRLFGCPHLDRVLASYQEVSPLADGWRERVGLHQLFPVLVHAVLFGRGYADQALRLLP